MNTSKWTTALDANTEKFSHAFGQLSEEELNWKPDPNTWSIAQNIDHLITINSTYFPIIASLHQGSYKLSLMGKVGFIAPVMGKMVLNAVGPDRKQKTKTFPIWEPSTSRIKGDILTRFSKHQEDLKLAIEGSADLLEKGVIISSPANKNIVYSLESAFDIIVSHEERHLVQAQELWEVKRNLQKN